MARSPQLFLPGFAQHIIQRGNNRQAVFVQMTIMLLITEEAASVWECKTRSRSVRLREKSRRSAVRIFDLTPIDKIRICPIATPVDWAYVSDRSW